MAPRSDLSAIDLPIVLYIIHILSLYPKCGCLSWLSQFSWNCYKLTWSQVKRGRERSTSVMWLNYSVESLWKWWTKLLLFSRPMNVWMSVDSYQVNRCITLCMCSAVLCMAYTYTCKGLLQPSGLCTSLDYFVRINCPHAVQSYHVIKLLCCV